MSDALKSGSMPIVTGSIWVPRAATDKGALYSSAPIRITFTDLAAVRYRNAFGRHGPERSCSLDWFCSNFRPREAKDSR